jgi:parallel beta-helix repeat protein
MKTKNIFRPIAVLFILLFIFIFFSQFSIHKALAATYYVDASLGLDTNSGTSTDSAWKNLSKVTTKTFQGGDSILFKKGEQWQGGITVKISGSETVPVTVGSYGDPGATAPILNGAITAPSGWNQYNQSIYSLSLASSSAASFKQVIVDGSRLDPARTPNSTYFTISQVISPTSFISTSTIALISAQDIGKTTIYFRSADWRIDKRTLTAFDSATGIVTFDSALPAGYTLTAGRGFYLMNAESYLDQPGEWFYDDISKQLFVWLRSSDSPAAHSVELSTTTTAITSTNLATLIIENLDVRNYAGTAIYVNNASTTIRNISINNTLERAIYSSSKNSIVENNTISNSYQGGIYIYRSDLVDTLSIRSNTLLNSGALGNQGNPGQDLNGINLNHIITGTVSDNIITNSGYAGMTVSGSMRDSILITNNTIENYCLYLSDCGGIYLNGNSFNSGFRPEIAYNNLKNGVGDSGGINATYGTIVMGIYLDLKTSYANVHHNIVDRTTGHAGIFVHRGNNNIIDSNTIYQYNTWPTIGFLKSKDTNFTPPMIYPMSGNVTSNNHFIVEKIFNNNLDMVLYNVADTDNNFGTFTNNTINSDLVTTITSPLASSTVSETVTITATATSTKSTVSKVEFYIDGNPVATDTTAPYSTSWNTSSLAYNSQHTLISKVYDTVGNTASGTPIFVTITDTVAPTVTITSPINNAKVSKNTIVTIRATATDSFSGISKVEFYVNGILKCTDTASLYTCAWTVPSPRGVAYALQAKAYDLANNSASSALTTVISK